MEALPFVERSPIGWDTAARRLAVRRTLPNATEDEVARLADGGHGEKDESLARPVGWRRCATREAAEAAAKSLDVELLTSDSCATGYASVRLRPNGYYGVDDKPSGLYLHPFEHAWDAAFAFALSTAGADALARVKLERRKAAEPMIDVAVSESRVCKLFASDFAEHFPHVARLLVELLVVRFERFVLHDWHREATDLLSIAATIVRNNGWGAGGGGDKVNAGAIAVLQNYLHLVLALPEGLRASACLIPVESLVYAVANPSIITLAQKVVIKESPDGVNGNGCALPLPARRLSLSCPRPSAPTPHSLTSAPPHPGDNRIMASIGVETGNHVVSAARAPRRRPRPIAPSPRALDARPSPPQARFFRYAHVAYADAVLHVWLSDGYFGADAHQRFSALEPPAEYLSLLFTLGAVRRRPVCLHFRDATRLDFTDSSLSVHLAGIVAFAVEEGVPVVPLNVQGGVDVHKLQNGIYVQLLVALARGSAAAEGGGGADDGGGEGGPDGKAEGTLRICIAELTSPLRAAGRDLTGADPMVDEFGGAVLPVRLLSGAWILDTFALRQTGDDLDRLRMRPARPGEVIRFPPGAPPAASCREEAEAGSSSKADAAAAGSPPLSAASAPRVPKVGLHLGWRPVVPSLRPYTHPPPLVSRRWATRSRCGRSPAPSGWSSSCRRG